MKRGILGVVVVAGVLAFAPRAVQACGGFFCQRSPMNQSGENIVFSVEDDGTMTTHVQILYSGEAEDFAWILPVPSEPQLELGTDDLFGQLHQRTAPRFVLERETEGVCREEPTCPSHAMDGSIHNAPALDAGTAAADGGGSGVEVHLRDEVGPYDAAVLSSGDADALRSWLQENDYDIPEEAAAPLDHYVDKGDFFVALKLQSGRSSGEIQPLVLRYEEDTPCIPIRLTRIATVPDMPIRAYVLGSHNARPLNFAAVQPDLDEPDLWLGPSASVYGRLVNETVDEEADGHGFVTEYAGPTPDLSLRLAVIDDLRAEEDPAAFLNELRVRGFTGDTKLLAILQRHLPPPEDVDPQSFYNCLVDEWCSSFDEHIEELDFDPEALVDALDEEIVAPRERAAQMLERQDQLTRLFTTMNANEMTIDPLFELDSSLADVSNVHEATLVTECGPEYFHWSAPQRLAMPTGTTARVREGVPYHGSDAEYCEDRESGDFAPGADPERMRRTSMERASSAGGGCSAADTVGGVALHGMWALALTGLVLAWRARRSPRRRRDGHAPRNGA